MLCSTRWGAGLWLGTVLWLVSGCGSSPAGADGGSDGSTGSDAAAEASARPCSEGGWCNEPHSGSTGSAPSTSTAAFAGSLSAPPLAVFHDTQWASRDASMQWTYSAYPAPSSIDQVAATMQGYAPSASWVGVANNAVYHWSSTQGMRGFSMGEGATVVAAAAVSATELWVATVRAPAPNSGERPTVVARHWRMGAWVDVDVSGVLEVAALVPDAPGGLIVFGSVREAPGVFQYRLQRVTDSGAAMYENVALSQFFQYNVTPGLASIAQDRAGALWLSNGERVWRRATSAMPWSEVTVPTGRYRVFPSERGAAVTIRDDAGAYSLVEFDSGSLAMSARSAAGADLSQSALHVSNAAVWRGDRDRSIWRLSAP